ncbi:2-dehydropantoate 2-reductase [Desulforhopalus singaporensis]|uniref:2-dehydropantoate 2-reductase n=2 Tax=Desulforhopalus singaporensis TaxID=91360 RepID=A0A1H0UPF8_9BACT|nr:2-dehydropantoate 2-reductase [Desulforhopalus singaporensis]
MKIVIVGGGAIGRLFGASLVKGKNDVTVIDKNPAVVDEMQRNGIGVMANKSDSLESIESVPVTALADAATIKKCDLVLLTVKSFATRAAAESVAHLVTENSPIVFMQTGLGNQAILREMFPVKAIIAGLTFMSGTALGNSRVRRGRRGLTFIGELGEVGELTGDVTPRLKNICQIFNDSDIPTKWSHKIIGRLWAKVITYATLNTLTSVFKVPNGQLLQHEESIRLVKLLLAEGEMVAKARGVEPIVDDLYELFVEVVQESANNLSSMLQDILNGRPTEIEAQSGAIANYAEKFGLEVPRHQMMTSILKLMEAWPMER